MLLVCLAQAYGVGGDSKLEFEQVIQCLLAALLFLCGSKYFFGISLIFLGAHRTGGLLNSGAVSSNFKKNHEWMVFCTQVTWRSHALTGEGEPQMSWMLKFSRQ